MKTWQRYFIFEFIKTLLFVLVLIFVLYSLIDFSSRRASFLSEGISFSPLEVLWYYLCSFSKELTVLLPFSAMIAVIRCVSELNRNRELIALLASGTSLRTLLFPFFLIGVVLSLLSLGNQEFFYPKAMRSIHQMAAKKKASSKRKKTPVTAVKSTHLQDNSTLLYTSFDQDTNSLIDVVWIRSVDNIYKIGSLSLDSIPPIGQEVDHFERMGTHLSLVSTEKTKVFTELPKTEDLLLDNLVEQDELPLTALIKMAPSPLQCESEKECGIMTSLILRLILPWINLLAIIGPLPLLVNMGRTQPLFFIFSVSLFSLVFLFLLIEAAAILGKRQTFPPLTAILAPFLIIFLTVLIRYFSLK